MKPARTEVLNGSNLAASRGADGCDARPDRFAVLMHGTGAAQGHAAAKLCSRQSQDVAHVPQQGHTGIAVERAIYSIHSKTDHRPPFLFSASILPATGKNPANVQIGCETSSIGVTL